MPQFAHLPLLLKPDGDGKLSKRDGDRLGLPFYAISWKSPETGETTAGYREAGYFPEAYVNFLALLGWNPGDNREMFSMDELVQVFSLERVNKHGARYDFQKLAWFNQQYLRKISPAALADLVRPQVESAGWTSTPEFLEEVCRLMQERLTIVGDFTQMSTFFFEFPRRFDQEVVEKRWKSPVPACLLALADALEGVDSVDAEALEALFQSKVGDSGLKPGQVMQAFRLALSGEGGGPALFEMGALLGRDSVVARLRRAVEQLGHG
jgi:glutamyl-tRNA synthetase